MANRNLWANIMLKNVLCLCLVLLCGLQLAFASTSDKNVLSPQIWVDGAVLTFNSITGISFVDDNGRTQVPLRKALEALGAKVTWDPKSQTIGVALTQKKLTLKIGERSLNTSDGTVLQMDAAPLLKGGKVYLPIHPVVKALGGYVNWRPDVKAVALTVNAQKWPVVKLTLGGKGTGLWRGRAIHLRLNPEAAPITVENFLALVNSGFYEGTLLHRIVSNFVVQGGDPTGTGTGGPGSTIKGEFVLNGVANPLRHLTGTLSMARSSDYDSAGSQFFICLNNQPGLDGQYAAFGEVIEGMDAILEIGKVQVDNKSRPLEAIWIESVSTVPLD